MVEHVDIPDSGLHEPRGVGTATVGTVYQANGLGSGSWEEMPFPSNEVVVETELDFGVASGGVITLTANTAYRIVGAVTANNKLRWAEGVVLWSPDPQTCTLTYTGTDDFIVAVDESPRAMGVTLACPNQDVGKFVLRQDATVSTPSIVFDRVIADSCDGFIKSTNASVVVSGSRAAYTTKCYDITGSAIPFLSLKGHTYIDGGASAIAIDITGAVIGGLILDESLFIGSGTAIAGDTGSANMASGSTGFVTRCDFSGMATNLSNISEDDDSWHFVRNTGQDATHESGSGYIQGNAIATAFSGTGVGNEVKMNFGTDFIPVLQKQMTVDNTGTITYTGEDEHQFYFSCEFFAEVSGGAARDYLFFLNKNGVIDESTGIKRRYDGSSPGTSSVSGTETLAKGDTVEVFIRALTATTSITVDTASMKIFGVR